MRELNVNEIEQVNGGILGFLKSFAASVALQETINQVADSWKSPELTPNLDSTNLAP
jgi:hypothetical protein